jgi:CHASE3 domain sensor protein
MPAKKFWPSLLTIQKKNCNPYFIVIMITVLIMNVIFWVVNFKTQNYFVISTTQNVYLRLSIVYFLIKQPRPVDLGL